MMIISDLPHDLESEILSRVPAKSLWELRATCKRWYALLRDPWFVEKNKKMGKAVRESMLLSNLRVSSIAGDLHGLYNNGVEPSIMVTGKLGSLEDSKDLKFSHIFHCDGLMLCYTKGNTRLLVWNPCTGETMNIEPRTRYERNDTYALGYSTSSSSGHSYKILRYWYYENDQKEWIAESEIYELSSDSWRVNLDSFTCDYTLSCEGITLKGNHYLVAENEETVFFLMKFDFTTERFVRLPLPFQSFNSENTVVALSVVKDEKLSVLHQNIYPWSNVMRLWVTNNVDEDLSWRSDFVLTVDFDKFDLPSVVNVTSFLLDEENKVAVCCDKDPDDKDKTRMYIVGEDMYKQVYKDNVEASRFNWPLVLTYVPSLVCIQKKTPRTKRRKRRRLSFKCIN
ncbi:hypothetical protein IGI04_018901 [Brassica rapa subsp. trilocularis]|uniref:F-box domain-containing protein n=1 Tax=Brassica rapa subsp. trilocularis TaxID=1813537 RepID=A0ABQ7ME96_BRACM|nr:hypothetical protein IGI04_018901 [Brassica rapa subsp. trilocularis]